MYTPFRIYFEIVHLTYECLHFDRDYRTIIKDVAENSGTASPAEPTASPAEPTASPAEPTASPAEPTDRSSEDDHQPEQEVCSRLYTCM